MNRWRVPASGGFARPAVAGGHVQMTDFEFDADALLTAERLFDWLPRVLVFNSLNADSEFTIVRTCATAIRTPWFVGGWE